MVRGVRSAEGIREVSTKTKHSTMVGSLDNVLLVPRGSAGLLGVDETGTNPHALGAEREGHGETAAIGDTTGSNNHDVLAGKRRLLALAKVNDLGDKDRGRDLAGVATALGALGADNVDTNGESLGDVLGGTDHVHDRDAGSVELVDSPLGRNTDGRDEEVALLLNHDVDELGQGAASVVLVGLTGVTADLGEQEVDTPREVGVLELGLDLLDLALKTSGGEAILSK